MVAAISRSIAMSFAKILPLKLLSPPLDLPQGTIGQVWHARSDEDAANAWLRGVIAEIGKDLDSAQRKREGAAGALHADPEGAALIRAGVRRSSRETRAWEADDPTSRVALCHAVGLH